MDDGKTKAINVSLHLRLWSFVFTNEQTHHSFIPSVKLEENPSQFLVLKPTGWVLREHVLINTFWDQPWHWPLIIWVSTIQEKWSSCQFMKDVAVLHYVHSCRTTRNKSFFSPFVGNDGERNISQVGVFSLKTCQTGWSIQRPGEIKKQKVGEPGV